MPDLTQIRALIGFELLLLILTVYSVARRGVLFGAAGRTRLPMSFSTLAALLLALGAAMVVIGGLHPTVAIVLIVSIAAAWITVQRYGRYANGPVRPGTATMPDDRHLAIRGATAVAGGYILAAVVVGGGMYLVLINMGIPREEARTVIAAILAMLGLWTAGICLSILRRGR